MKENGADFFAKPEYRTESYEAPADDLLYGRILGLSGERRMVTKQRQVVVGFDCTAETPFKSIRITAYPAYENLPHAVAVIVFVFSKKDFVVFYTCQTVKEMDWGKLANVDSRKWSYFSVVMKKDPSATKAAGDLIQRFETFLTKVAREKLGLEEEAQEADAKTENKDASKAEKPAPAKNT